MNCLTIKLALEKKPFTLHGQGQQRRVWVHVTDCVDALLRILTLGEAGQKYNIGTDEVLSVLDVAYTIHHQINGETPFEILFQPDRPHNDKLYWIQYDKLVMTCGWRSKISWEEGIKQTIQVVLEFVSLNSQDHIASKTAPPRTIPRFRVLLYGHNGWLGGKFMRYGQERHWDMVEAKTRPGENSLYMFAYSIKVSRPTKTSFKRF